MGTETRLMFSLLLISVHGAQARSLQEQRLVHMVLLVYVAADVLGANSYDFELHFGHKNPPAV